MAGDIIVGISGGQYRKVRAKYMANTRKLKIVSDGTLHGTAIIDIESGEKKEGIDFISWEADANGGGIIGADVHFTKIAVRVTTLAKEIKDMH
jgi:hypothetical protein